MIKQLIETAIKHHNKLNKTNFALEENTIIINDKGRIWIRLYNNKELIAEQKTYDLTYDNINQAYLTLFTDVFSCGLVNLNKF